MSGPLVTHQLRKHTVLRVISFFNELVVGLSLDVPSCKPRRSGGRVSCGVLFFLYFSLRGRANVEQGSSFGTCLEGEVSSFSIQVKY